MRTFINRQTGSIRLPGHRNRLKPLMTLDEFLACSLSSAIKSDRGRGRQRWFHYPPIDFDGASFLLSVLFVDGVIELIDLTCNEDRYGVSWEDWSRKKERARKAFHDRWLRAQLGPAPLSTTYRWGTVASYFDERGGGSVITIRYASA